METTIRATLLAGSAHGLGFGASDQQLAENTQLMTALWPIDPIEGSGFRV